jgi:L-ascorbate metabolism protein UlaG (beta-lactamase superfamily)
VITTANRRLFFSGDTGLTDEFASWGAVRSVRCGDARDWGLAPAWGDIHLGPENALRAFEMLGKGTLLPVHWGTFDLGLPRVGRARRDAPDLAEPAGARVLTPVLGRPFEPAHVEGPTPWWRGLGVGGAQPRELGAPARR